MAVAGDNSRVRASVDFSPDSQWLAATNPSFGDGNHITVWDINSQQTMASSEEYADYVAFAPDGQHLFSSRSDGVTYWGITPDGLQEINRLTFDDTDEYHYPLHIAVSPTGTIAIGKRNVGITVWNPITNETDHCYNDSIPYGDSLHFSPDGHILAFDNGSDIILWDVTTGEQIGGSLQRAGLVAGFSQDGQTLLSSSRGDESLQLWAVDTQSREGEPFNRWGRTKEPLAAAFSPDGKTLASSYTIGDIILWDATGLSHLGQEVGQVSGNIQKMSFMDEQELVVQTRDGEVTFWDISSKTQLSPTLTLPISDPRSFVFSQNYKLAATHIYTNDISTIILSDPSTQQTIGKPITLTNYANSFTFSPDSTILAVGDSEGQLTLWDTATQEIIDAPLPTHTRAILSTTFSPDGKTLATGGAYEVFLWDMATHQPLLAPISIEADNLQFTDEGRKLVTRNRLGNSYLWDTMSGRFLGEITTSTGIWGRQSDIAFSPYHNLIATSNTGYINFREQIWQSSLFSTQPLNSR